MNEAKPSIDLDELIAEVNRARSQDGGLMNLYMANAVDLIDRLADALEAATRERDAAVAAIDRARAVHVSEGWPLYGGGESKEYCSRCNCRWPCETIQALDGAPEPEWEYGRRYVDEAGDPYIRVAQDVISPDGHRKDGSLYRNYQVVRRRPAGPWLPVEGEKP